MQTVRAAQRLRLGFKEGKGASSTGGAGGDEPSRQGQSHPPRMTDACSAEEPRVSQAMPIEDAARRTIEQLDTMFGTGDAGDPHPSPSTCYEGGVLVDWGAAKGGPRRAVRARAENACEHSRTAVLQVY